MILKSFKAIGNGAVW